jgi:anti-anti-sigma factor
MTELLRPEGDQQVVCGVVEPGGWHVELRGDIDLNTRPQLDAGLTAVTGANPAAIRVDLTQVTFLGSTGLKFLAELREHADTAGHTVTLHGPNRAVRRALTLIGFDQVFTIMPA